MARAQGAISIVTTRTSKKKAELISLGAGHVIVTNEENLPTRVNEITKGVNIVFDPIAGKGIEALAETLTPGGILFVYGNLSMEPITPLPLFTALKKEFQYVAIRFLKFLLSLMFAQKLKNILLSICRMIYLNLKLLELSPWGK